MPRKRPGTLRVTLTMTGGELQEIDRACRGAGLDRSAYIRSTVLAAIRAAREARKP